MHAAIRQYALAIAVGVVGADPTAHAPAHAPAPSLLPPHKPFLPSEEYIFNLRLSYGSFASIGDVELPLAPVGPDAE